MLPLPSTVTHLTTDRTDSASRNLEVFLLVSIDDGRGLYFVAGVSHSFLLSSLTFPFLYLIHNPHNPD